MQAANDEELQNELRGALGVSDERVDSVASEVSRRMSAPARGESPERGCSRSARRPTGWRPFVWKRPPKKNAPAVDGETASAS